MSKGLGVSHLETSFLDGNFQKEQMYNKVQPIWMSFVYEQITY